MLSVGVIEKLERRAKLAYAHRPTSQRPKRPALASLTRPATNALKRTKLSCAPLLTVRTNLASTTRQAH